MITWYYDISILWYYSYSYLNSWLKVNIKQGVDFIWNFNMIKWFERITCVWLIPKLAANSARSGRARYWVRWNRLSRCWVCSDEYIDLGFRIFLPLPLTRVVISPFSIEYVAPEMLDSTGGSSIITYSKEIYKVCSEILS